jgi:hypothetical protein
VFLSVTSFVQCVNNKVYLDRNLWPMYMTLKEDNLNGDVFYEYRSLHFHYYYYFFLFYSIWAYDIYTLSFVLCVWKNCIANIIDTGLSWPVSFVIKFSFQVLFNRQYILYIYSRCLYILYTYNVKKKDYYPQETKAITSKLFTSSGYRTRVNISRFLKAQLLINVKYMKKVGMEKCWSKFLNFSVLNNPILKILKILMWILVLNFRIFIT